MAKQDAEIFRYNKLHGTLMTTQQSFFCLCLFRAAENFSQFLKTLSGYELLGVGEREHFSCKTQRVIANTVWEPLPKAKVGKVDGLQAMAECPGP